MAGVEGLVPVLANEPLTRYTVRSASSGKWRKAQHRPGSGGSSEPYHADRLRWRTQSATALVTAHLYIPPFFFLEAKDELNLDDLTCPNHHGFVNPLTAQIVTAVAAAAEQGIRIYMLKLLPAFWLLTYFCQALSEH